jgi:hypothetical protein
MPRFSIGVVMKLTAIIAPNPAMRRVPDASHGRAVGDRQPGTL